MGICFHKIEHLLFISVQIYRFSDTVGPEILIIIRITKNYGIDEPTFYRYKLRLLAASLWKATDNLGQKGVAVSSVAEPEP
jgi:hypothetical protein